MIEAWARRERVTIAGWHVGQGEAPDGAGLTAALDALPAAGAGWLVAASVDRVSEEAFLGVFESATHANGARLVFADGSGGPPSGQRCPTCDYPVHPWARYPRALCGLCLHEAKDEAGRRLLFYNIDATGGFRAEYADTGEERRSHICYVRGVKCWADEAHFGGIVIQAME